MGDKSRVTALLQAANPPYSPIKLRRPLQLACKGHKVEVVEELIRFGANMNAMGKPGDADRVQGTPLCTATRHEGSHGVDLVDFLLKSGADGTIADSEGNTPLHMACDSDDDDLLSSLVKYATKAQRQALNQEREAPFDILIKKIRHRTHIGGIPAPTVFLHLRALLTGQTMELLKKLVSTSQSQRRDLAAVKQELQTVMANLKPSWLASEKEKAGVGKNDGGGSSSDDSCPDLGGTNTDSSDNDSDSDGSDETPALVNGNSDSSSSAADDDDDDDDDDDGSSAAMTPIALADAANERGRQYVNKKDWGAALKHYKSGLKSVPKDVRYVKAPARFRAVACECVACCERC